MIQIIHFLTATGKSDSRAAVRAWTTKFLERKHLLKPLQGFKRGFFLSPHFLQIWRNFSHLKAVFKPSHCIGFPITLYMSTEWYDSREYNSLVS